MTGARLLSFSRGRHITGGEVGPALVRSLWLAQVEVGDWDPQFEIRFRRVVSPAEPLAMVLLEYAQFWARAFYETGWDECGMPIR